MPSNKAEAGKRKGARAVEAEMLATAHDLAVGLYQAGVIDDEGLREFEQECLPPRPGYGSTEVKRIRAATKMSQPAFARLLGVGESVVVQWEAGARRPSGPALRLLEVLDPDKPESPVVLVRREMTRAA